MIQTYNLGDDGQRHVNYRKKEVIVFNSMSLFVEYTAYIPICNSFSYVLVLRVECVCVLGEGYK